jgi:hypothetical protein
MKLIRRSVLPLEPLLAMRTKLHIVNSEALNAESAEMSNGNERCPERCGAVSRALRN